MKYESKTFDALYIFEPSEQVILLKLSLFFKKAKK
jgi:hypothetical protein